MINKYDVIVIGAGIGGLISGCYLAKEGLKVLIVDLQDKPGGYCTSFTKDGYNFDVAVHYLAGIRKGILGTILDELNLRGKLILNQFSPTDKIILPKKKIFIEKDCKETLNNLKSNFSKENASIDKFFNFIYKSTFFDIYKKVSQTNAIDLLNEFFKDYELKAVFNTILRNVGLSSKECSSVAFITLLKDYILDPGYYPRGGIQQFPNTIMNEYLDCGGEIIFKKSIEKIILKNNRVYGVVLNDGTKLKAKIIISNNNASDTFLKLVDQSLAIPEKRILKKLLPSTSFFVLYVGLNKEFKIEHSQSYNVWPFYGYDLNKNPINTKNALKQDKASITTICFPYLHDKTSTKKTMSIFSATNIVNYKYWKENREIYSDLLINAALDLVPEFKNHIEIKLSATPCSFLKYTGNLAGSAFGWASNKNQISSSLLPQKTSIPGLFLAGHWCMVGSGQGGVSKSAFSGRRAAIIILNEMKMKHKYNNYFF